MVQRQSDGDLSWGQGFFQVQRIKSHLFRSEGLVQDVVPSVSFILSYSNIGLGKGNVDLKRVEIRFTK